MIVYRSKEDLAGHLQGAKKEGSIVGLVPTMGALHKGHASLVEQATRECDIVIVTIFVNPTQFNNPSDLEHYPRTLDQDLEMLRSLDASIVFVPSELEMYPEKDSRIFDLTPLDRVMEGRYREGHFNGVAQIVSKLFTLVQPHRAYFGQKDFQQLVIIRHMVDLLNMNVEVVACPIIREKDGLAMSSRNIRLGPAERNEAPKIYQILKEAAGKKDLLSPSQLKLWVGERFKNQCLVELVYFEIVDDKGLKPVMSWEDEQNKVACIAVILGGVRLIDNLIFD